MHDLRLVVGFAFHTIVAGFLFALVGAAAALLHYYTELLSRLGMPYFILEAIKGTEYFLFGVDMICFVVFVAHETWMLLRSIVAPASAAIESPR